jgi:hypothetical protein
MQNRSRETLLKLAVALVAGLFLLDRVVLTPSIARWKQQSERLDSLRQKVGRGKQLLARGPALRARWADMQHSDLAAEGAEAENEVFKSVGRWARESRVNFSSLTPQWRGHDDGYDAFECRATATGDQAALGRLLYELETDPLPARIEECEITARDAQGKQIGLSLRFSFVRLRPDSKR